MSYLKVLDSLLIRTLLSVTVYLLSVLMVRFMPSGSHTRVLSPNPVFRGRIVVGILFPELSVMVIVVLSK